MNSRNEWAQLKRDGFHLILTEADGTFLPEETAIFDAGASSGEWFIVAPKGAHIRPDMLDLLARTGQERPDVGIFYGDDVVCNGSAHGFDLALKPDWDLTLLLADDYIGLPLFIRANAARRIGAINITRTTAACFDVLLRAHAAGVAIARIPEVLASFPGTRPRARIEDRMAAIRDNGSNSASEAFEVQRGLTNHSLRIDKTFAEIPDVTLVVPTRQSSGGVPTGGRTDPFIIAFLDSVATSSFPMDKLHVLVGDDVDDVSIYADRRWPFHLRRIHTLRAVGEPFNYAAKMNALWRHSETEHVVLMNDDLTICSPDWLQALLSFSVQSNVGGVGARLLYPDGRIQHAGMPGGVFGLCTHAWIGEPASAPTYQDWGLVHREWSMVTGAVFATRKSLLDEVGGFDEAFRLDFNDVDLCLKLRMLGYRIVYTPHAQFIHHEKGSRGTATWPASELARFLQRWGEFLRSDPSYNPRLSRNHHIIQPAPLQGEWWQSAG